MMRSTDVKIAIIILTMNQREKTLRCLASFRQVTHRSFKILLWDNGSQDGTAEAVRQAYPEVFVHNHPTNAGVAGGRNQAVQLAIEQFNPPYLFFIDNDMTVTPDFLDQLVAPFAGHPQLAQTTGKIKDMDQPQRFYGAGGCRIKFLWGDTRHVGYTEIDHGQYNTPKRCIPSGGCMLVRTDIFQQLDGFETIFGLYGPEDLDFGLRVIEAGYHGYYVPQAVVYHESRPGRTFEGGQYSQKYASARAKNWILFMRRHAPVWQQLGFWLVGLPYLLSGFVVRQAKQGNLRVALQGLLRGALKATSNGI